MSLIRCLIPALGLTLMGCDAATVLEPGPPVKLLVRDGHGIDLSRARPLIFVDGRLLPSGYDLRELAAADIVGVEVIKPVHVGRGAIYIYTRAGKP